MRPTGALPDLVGLQQRLPGGGRGEPANRRERPEPAAHLAPEPVPPDRATAALERLPGRAPGQRLGRSAGGLAAAAREQTRISPRNAGVFALQVALALLLGWALRRLRPPCRGRRIRGRRSSTIPGRSACWSPPRPERSSTARCRRCARSASGWRWRSPPPWSPPACSATATSAWSPTLISAAYVLFAALEAVALPVPLLRGLLAVLAVAGVPSLLVLAAALAALALAPPAVVRGRAARSARWRWPR